MRTRVVLLAIPLTGVATPALANVIWPGLILTGRLLAWWIIAASLVIEFLFVRRAFGLTPLNAGLATLAANAASAAIGYFAVPYLSLFMEAALQATGIAGVIGWDAFSPAGWTVTFLLAVALSLGIELAVYRFGFGLPVDSRIVALLLLANAITAGVAWASLGVVPHDFY